MHVYVYPARITSEPEGGWLIRFRDLPDAISQAELDEDPVDMAEGCVQAAIEGRLLYHEAIPLPTAPRPGEVMVAVPLETATKAALFQRVAECGMSQSALAKVVGLDEREIRRMLDPEHASKLPRIAKVLRALGKELQLTVADAAQMPKTVRREVSPARVEARQPLSRYPAKPKKAKRVVGKRATTK
jgi:antitoxin HicB